MSSCLSCNPACGIPKVMARNLLFAVFFELYIAKKETRFSNDRRRAGVCVFGFEELLALQCVSSC